MSDCKKFHPFFEMMGAVHKMIDTRTEPVLKKYDLTPSCTPILFYLNRHPDKNTASEICKVANLKRSIVSTLVDSMCKKNLMVQERDYNDKRQQRLFLTDDGKKVCSELIHVFAEISDLFDKAMTVEEKEFSIKIMEKFKEVACENKA